MNDPIPVPESLNNEIGAASGFATGSRTTYTPRTPLVVLPYGTAVRSKNVVRALSIRSHTCALVSVVVELSVSKRSVALNNWPGEI